MKKAISWIKFIIDFFHPPPQWKLVAIVLSGVLVGLAMLIFKISNAPSYLSKDPQACINCHVMWPQYSSWQRSSHREKTTCVDCHIPHDNVVHSYLFKMQDGLRHSTIFTARTEPQVIMIKEAGVAAVQQNCIRCHSSTLEDLSVHQATYEQVKKGEAKLCWDCHREVPHGRVHSLSSNPHALVPGPENIVPRWMQQIVFPQQETNKINEGSHP